ncbi:hypothetical protein SO802_016365 [Lithocarpus litseifolius]|uniref:C2H2-type domain-containing protein n=1 Tax=Lithocarpus litseifolius TaxID=425828 RepID=A0AAW2CXS5_9ROSI
MDNLAAVWNRLSLLEQEGEVFNFNNQKCRTECMLAAKFFTKRVLNIDVVARTLKPLWRTKHDFETQDMGDHIMLFVFESEVDANRVLLGEPWSFYKYLIVLRRYEDDSSLRRLSFDRAKFWVQVHGLPVWWMVTEVAEDLCQFAGRVIQAKDRSETECGDFMRIRVEIDVHKPLCCGRKVRFSQDREGWVTFRYERLPIFFHWCGVLSHDLKDCDLWLQSKGELRVENKGCGPWLRADPPSLSRKKVVRVSGSGASMALTRAPNAPTADSVREKGALEGIPTEVHQHPDWGRSDMNLDNSRDEGEQFQGATKISVILRSEAAFQEHLKEIDRELEDNLVTMQGVKETNTPLVGGVISQGKEGVMVNDSNLIGKNLIQSEVEISDKGPSYPKREGMMSCPITVKRRQHKPKADNAVVVEDVEVGSKQAVLSIPLSASLPADKLIWAPTSSGQFTDNVCEECGVAVESSGYLFWHCSRAHEVWKASNLGLEIGFGKVHEFIDLVWYARNVKQMDAQALAQLFMIAWGIWSNRNETRTGGSRKSASSIVRWTLDYLEEFQVANHKIQITFAESEPGWSLPLSPGFKVNVDAAIFENLRSVGIGIVIRDHLGFVRAALSMKIRALLGPFETEAKAMEEGLRFAWDRGLDQLSLKEILC